MSRITREINKISMTVISISGRLVFYVLVVVLLLMGARKGYEFGHSIFYSPGMEKAPGTEKALTLDGKESVEEVGKILEDIGLIRDHTAFSIQARCYDYKVKKGTFRLNTSLSSKEIIKRLGEESEEEENKP
ncbi:MAG: aminodeoxychorismate lyase [Lachnospiraceae bacterium]|nr:aminodeoxychorismate lyase [Lachnospiraceae bacterium]